MTSFDLIALTRGTVLLGTLFILMSIIATSRKGDVSFKWFGLALLAFAFNDFGLSLGRWATRPITEALAWNWSGKILALFLTVAFICLLPQKLRSQVGLRFRQAKGSLAVWMGIGIYASIFLAIAVYSPPPQTDAYWESLAFQLTMPSLDEELFFRGLLPVVIDRSFRVSRNILGAQIGWGAIISSVMFGLVHGLSLKGGLSIDWIACAIPGGIGLIGCWIVQKTKSLLGPILMHSHGNAINYII